MMSLIVLAQDELLMRDSHSGPIRLQSNFSDSCRASHVALRGACKVWPTVEDAVDVMVIDWSKSIEAESLGD